MKSIHQRGPDAFTSYSTVYDLKNKKLYIYNLANYNEMITFDLIQELEKGPKLYKMKSLFKNSPPLGEIKKSEQRIDFGTRVLLDFATLDTFVGTYSPVEAVDTQFRIERTGLELQVINPGQPDAFLFPETPTVFRLYPNNGQVSFEVDKNGVVQGLTLHKARDFKAIRVSTED